MMNDYMIEGIFPGEDLEQSLAKIQDGQVPPIAWEGLHARLHWETRTEQLWEWGFVIAAFGMVGWYMFWFFTALQNFTIIPLP